MMTAKMPHPNNEKIQDAYTLIYMAIGKEVVPDFKTYGQNEDFEANNIDLSKVIMMDIEEED